MDPFEMLANVDPLAITKRVFHMLIFSFVFLYAVAYTLGNERKHTWFRKRKKYTFFNRRGVLGEDLNFGYPCTWQGILVFLAIHAVILGGGYLYIFLMPY